MSDREFFNFSSATTRREKEGHDFSKMPVIRRFESLLTDEDLASVGFRVAAHPTRNTFYIYRAAETLATEDDNPVVLNAITPRRHVVHHGGLWIDPFAGDTQTQIDFAPIAERIEELRAIAVEDEIPFNDNSAQEALEWLRLASPPILPSVFLVNNGNTRLFWRHQNEQLGIQFLGDGTAQFVFLGDDDQTERIFGSIRVSELLKRINGLDLFTVLGLHSVEWTSKAVRTSFGTSADHILTAVS
jgi:hypothetical protein